MCKGWPLGHCQIQFLSSGTIQIRKESNIPKGNHKRFSRHYKTSSPQINIHKYNNNNSKYHLYLILYHISRRHVSHTGGRVAVGWGVICNLTMRLGSSHLSDCIVFVVTFVWEDLWSYTNNTCRQTSDWNPYKTHTSRLCSNTWDLYIKIIYFIIISKAP